MNEQILGIAGISKELGDKKVLDDVDWEVLRGQHWVLMGKNGCGKTTLLRIATGYLWPSVGSVHILGSKIGTVDIRFLRRRIGWVSSAISSRIPNKQRALDVVLSGRFASMGLYDEPSAEDVVRAELLLKKLECDAVSGRAFEVLSSGEKQRVLIARALMPDPELLVLDEPAVGLDIPSREDFLRTVGDLARDGPTIIYVTHHIEEVVPEITNALLLKDGKKMFSGHVDDVLTSSNICETFDVKMSIKKNNGRFFSQMG